MGVFGFGLLFILYHTQQLDHVHSAVTYPSCGFIWMRERGGEGGGLCYYEKRIDKDGCVCVCVCLCVTV